MPTPGIIPTELPYFHPGAGRRIASRLRPARPKITGPTLVFLPGYASDMEGNKAMAIDAVCATRGLGCLRLDYSGTGSSGGEFGDGTVNRWLGGGVGGMGLLTHW